MSIVGTDQLTMNSDSSSDVLLMTLKLLSVN